MSNKGRGPIIGDVISGVTHSLWADAPGVGLNANPGMPDRDPAQDLTDVPNATGIAVLVLHDDLTIRYFTPAVRDLYLLRPEDIGRSITDIMSLCADPGLLVAVRQVLSEGSSPDCDIEATGGVWFRRSIEPCVTAEDLRDGLVITFVDMTRSRAELDHLATAERRARLADAAKSNFLLLANHDLRQPLQTMFILQGLLAASVTSERDKDLVVRLEEALESMLRVIDRFSEFNQTEAEAPPAVSPSVSGLDALLPSQVMPDAAARILIVEENAEVGDLLDMLLTDLGHQTVLTEDGVSALALMDERGFRPDIVLTNLDLPGGLDGLTLARQVQQRLNLRVPAILLTSDTRTDPIRPIADRDILHLTKPVTVERLTWAIGKLSEADQPPPEAPRAANSAVAFGALHPVAIHIVDDSSDFRQALRMLLESEGRSVCDYASCELFLAAYDPLMQGCVLLDAYLPGMGGLVLLDHLHAMDCKLPVVMITGQSDVAIAVAAMKGGAVDFLEKPVNAAEIRACIERALALPRPARLRGEVARDLREVLTPRQRQVLDGVLAGQASKTIAFDLGISQRTVESHRAALMDRVGARSVPELVRKVLVPT